MLMATDGRSVHCGDLHSNIPWYNILVVPSQVMGYNYMSAHPTHFYTFDIIGTVNALYALCIFY